MQDGNAIWKATAGRGQRFTDAESLWAAAVRYFEWAEANPLYEQKYFTYKGELKADRVARMRAMSVPGLRMFLGIGRKAWAEYCASGDFSEVAAHIEDVIRTQKLEGAAAGLLNASIIGRDLDLDEKKKRTEAPEAISDEELDVRIAEFLAKAGIGGPDVRAGTPAKEKPAGELPALSEAKGVPRRRRAPS